MVVTSVMVPLYTSLGWIAWVSTRNVPNSAFVEEASLLYLYRGEGASMYPPMPPLSYGSDRGFDSLFDSHTSTAYRCDLTRYARKQRGCGV